MRRSLKTAAAVAAILVIAGIAPAARPCCASSVAGARVAEVAPAPCCGPGCPTMASADSRSFLVSSDGDSSGPTLAAAALDPDRRLPALHSRTEGRPAVREGHSPGLALFVLHSQLLI